MSIVKPQSALGAAAMLLLATLSAAAQQTPATPPAESPPAAAPAEPGPSPQRPHAAPPSEAPAGHDLVGLSVFSSDGSKVGDVRAVNTGPSGNVAALHIRTGGFLGFGSRVVAIPEGSFARKGPDIRLTLTAEQVGNLPDVKGAK
jgi:hypothetical protein